MFYWVTLTGQARSGSLVEAFDYAFMAHDAMGETVKILDSLGAEVDYFFLSNGNPILAEYV